MARGEGTEEELASRLSLFDDEPDINDWFEVALGAAMITMGLHQLFNPGGLFEVGVMARGRSCRLWIHFAWPRNQRHVAKRSSFIHHSTGHGRRCK